MNTVVVESQGKRFLLPSVAQGQVLAGRFRLLHEVGACPPGVLWLMWDEEMGMESLLWILPPALKDSAGLLAALDRQVHRNREVVHRYIARTHELLVESDWIGISFEAIAGQPLSRVREHQRGKVFSVEEISGWIAQTGNALHDAHEEGVLHLDLCPENIWIVGSGEVRLVHFGLSRLIQDAWVQFETGESEKARRQVYSSPGVMNGEPPTPADDIYSFGVVIYDLLTGSPPFMGGSLYQQICSSVPPLMSERRKDCGIESLPSRWDKTVAISLEKQPGARPRSAEAVISMLGLEPLGATGGAGVSEKRTLRKRRGPFSKGPRVTRMGFRGFLLMLCLVMVLGLTWFVSQQRSAIEVEPPRQADSVNAESVTIPDDAPEEMVLEQPDFIPTELLPSAVPETKPEADLASEPEPAPARSPGPEGEPMDLSLVIPGLGAVRPSDVQVSTVRSPVTPDFENSLGMQFIGMDGVQFSVWLTRVQDFERFLGKAPTGDVHGNASS